MLAHCLEVSVILSFLLLANIAAPTKNGSEKSIRIANNVSASVGVCANASLTMIAFVENKMDPAKARINPAIGIVVLLFFGNIIKQSSPKIGAGYFTF